MLTPTEFARLQRREQSRAERLLWSRLRNRALLGFKFRRQVPIGPYCADFACWKARLIVEADGPDHAARLDLDSRRDAWLAEQGWRVMRFPEADCRKKTGQILERIEEALRSSGAQP